MKLVFTVETGQTFLSMTMAAEDKELIDGQCRKLGLLEGNTRQPLGVAVSESISFWKDARAGQLAAAVQRRLVRDLRNDRQTYNYLDDINGKMFSGELGSNETVNIGVLRFRPTVGTPLKLKISDEILDPEVIMHIANAITKAMQVLATIVFEATYEITIERPRTE